MNTSLTPSTSPAARVWPWAVVGVLGLTVAGNLYMLRLAGADASMTIEPDYYNQALRWDAHQAQQGTNAALGWSFRVDAAAAGELRVRASDAAGEPLRGLEIRIAGSANRAGDAVERAVLREAGNGEYIAAMPLRGGGLWRMTLSADGGAAHYEATLMVDAGRPPS